MSESSRALAPRLFASCERLGLAAALLGIVLAWGGAAHAQDADDDAADRLTGINNLRLLVLRPSALSLWRPDAAGPARSFDGGASLGLALAVMEKKGAAYEALRVDHLDGWLGQGAVDLAFTLVDLQMVMLGTGQDGDPCMASIPLVALGDCVGGGAMGFRLQLLHHEWESEHGRWFNRWFEAGGVLNLLGGSFDVDFVEHRLPLLLGVSLDQVTHAALPDGGTSDLRLRGVAGADLVLRLARLRFEVQASVRYRPSLAPFDLTDDWGLETSLRFGYLWLARILGPVRASIQRIFLDVRFAHWERPWLADRWTDLQSKNSLQILLGFELTLRDVSPS